MSEHAAAHVPGLGPELQRDVDNLRRLLVDHAPTDRFYGPDGGAASLERIVSRLGEYEIALRRIGERGEATGCAACCLEVFDWVRVPRREPGS